MEQAIQAVILAAGLGSRLGELTRETPKALLRVAGRELILRVKDFLDHPSVEETIVVTGFLAGLLEPFLARHWPKARTVLNPHFADGSIRSIEAALPLVQDDAIILNADHIYPRRLWPRLAPPPRGLAAACDFDRTLGPDDMKVQLRDGTKALAAIDKNLPAFDGGYIGMTLLPAEELWAYRAAVAIARREDGDGSAVERALAHLARKGHPIGIRDTSGIRWLEVDTPEDLEAAEQTLTTNPGFLL